MLKMVLRTMLLGSLVTATAYLSPYSAPQAQEDPLRAAFKRAVELNKAGKYADAIAHAKRAETLIAKRFGRKHETYTIVQKLLAGIHESRFFELYEAGRYGRAEPHAKQVLTIQEELRGENHPDVAGSLNNLAVLYENQGRSGEAEPLHKRALAIREKAHGQNHPNVAISLNNLAVLYDAQGRYAEAEPLHRRALAIREKVRGRNHPDVAESLNNLAILFRIQGRTAEAEPLYRRALAIHEKALGRDHTSVAASLNNLADLYDDLGRYAEAELLHRRALAIHEKVRGSNHPIVATSLNNLALVLGPQGRAAEAEPLHKRALAIREKVLGENHPDVATSLNNLAVLHRVLGRDAEAEPLYERALAIRQRALGQNHPKVAESLNNLGVLHRRLERWDDAYEHFRGAAAIRETLALRGIKQRRASGDRLRADTVVFGNLIEAAWQVGERQSGRRGNSAAAAFRAAQWMLSTSAGTALAQMAARFGVGNSELARVVRTRQDLAAKWEKLDKTLIKAIGAPEAKRNQTRVTDLRAALAATERRIAALNAEIEKEFPQFAEISTPKPLTIQQTQSLIKPDEALLFYVVAKDGIFVWVLSREDGRWGQIALTAKAVAEKVAALRRGLDLDGGAGSGDRGLSRASGEGLPFNLAIAHQLYQQLLAPFEDVFKDKKHLLIVPSDALTSLPFHVLTTAKPATELPDFAGYRQAAWLARRHAITVLPAVTSLRALRIFARKQRAKRQFIGFGDPIFRGSGTGADTRKPAEIASVRERGFRAYFRGDHADLDVLSRSLPQLPDTADELKAIARTLGVPKSEIRLREKATETAVKQAPLNRYRVVHFATHGLVAGQTKAVGGRAEPALALSLPTKATARDDGLLTASEVAQLKLNADWVILSACNTAAGDKPGAEALSGLARAFFYSGTRALLVSHWPVVSDAAVKLTTKTFAVLKADPTIGRSEALRRSMLALINKGAPHQAHPSYWAPFVVVGEGGRRKS